MDRLTHSEEAYVSAIRTFGPVTVTRLAQITGRSQPNISRAIDNLARRGVIQVERDARGRVVSASMAVGLTSHPAEARIAILDHVIEGLRGEIEWLERAQSDTLDNARSVLAKLQAERDRAAEAER